MSGGSTGEMPQGPNMGALASMTQAASADPTQRLIAAMPPLGYSIGMPQGLMATRMTAPFLFPSTLQSGSVIGPMAFVKQALQSCFVDVGTMSAWATSGLESVSAPNMEGAPIAAAAIEGAAISGAEVSAPSGKNSILVDAPEVSAPRVAAHQNAVRQSSGMDIG